MTDLSHGYYDQLVSERRKRIESSKLVLIKSLSTAGVARLVVKYDGEGDSGQVESIDALDAERKSVDIHGPSFIEIGKDENRREYSNLAGFVESFFWDLLGSYHDGFENNDGGFGEVIIDVTAGTVTLDHYDRFVDCVNSMTEV